MTGDTVKFFLDTLPIKPRGRVIALGLFDGMHKGHLDIIRTAVGLARLSDITSTVQTFSGFNKRGDGEILSLEERLEILSDTGADEMLVLDFDEVKDMDYEAFEEDILLTRMNASCVVCGFDYTYGKGGKGNTETLKAFCKSHDIGIKVIPERKHQPDGTKISSGWIKDLLRDGNVELVSELCGGRAFSYSGIVKEGKKLGRVLGFPTINVDIPEDKFLVRRGVYISRVKIGNEMFRGVTNIGLRPTVEDSVQDIAETHLIGTEGDLYGARVKVELLRFLRPETKFSDVEELKAMLAANKKQAEEFFSANV